MVIDGTVYDVSQFRSQHPGGANKIKCGKDISSEFSDQHGSGSKELRRISQNSKGALG